jgi:lysozyme
VTAIDLIKGFEGCNLEAYQDIGGTWTIGWGHVGKDVYEGLVWTQDQADQALTEDVMAAAAQLAIYSPGLSGGTLEALTDFVFNLGIANYRSSTLCKLVNDQNWPAVRAELLKWDHSDGAVIPGLYRRREAEADLI